MAALAIAIAWILGVTIICFRATQKLWAGFLLSLIIATSPYYVLYTKGGFTVRERIMLAEFMSMVVMIAMVVGLVVRDLRINRFRSDSQRCKTCGYNLTGNVSGVCPVCGMSVNGNV